MTVPTKTFPQFVGDMTTSWAAGIGMNPTLSPGDFLLATFESVSTQLDFLQAQALIILALTRAATSTGADLDSWMADFQFTRLPATFAVGPVTLNKFLPATSPVIVPAATLVGGVYTGGILVQTTGGAIVYRVIPDAAQSAYNAASNTYIMPVGATNITVTAQAVIAGSVSNVTAGSLNQLGSQQAGIDTTTNQVAILDGNDAESDASFRARFILFLATLARGTKQAILAAAQGVQQGLLVSTFEGQAVDGTPQNGAFAVLVDDGTGAPPASLIAAIQTAEDNTRAFGIQAFVGPPNIVNATVLVTIRVAPGSSLGALQPLVESAVSGATATLSSGDTLFISAIDNAALSVAGVVSVAPGTLINGVNADLVPAATAEIRVLVSGVSVGSY